MCVCQLLPLQEQQKVEELKSIRGDLVSAESLALKWQPGTTLFKEYSMSTCQVGCSSSELCATTLHPGEGLCLQLEVLLTTKPCR